MLNLVDLRSSEAKVRNGGSRYSFPACGWGSTNQLRGLGERQIGCSAHIGIFLARGPEAEDSVNVERLEIGMGCVRRGSVCTWESEEEMGELFLIRFLVVSELRGNGGHILDDGE